MIMGASDNVILVAESANAKLGGIATTHACSITCPSSCPLKDACYKHVGTQNYTSKSLDDHQRRLHQSHVTIARKEAKLIDNLTRQTDLRIHTVGDCKSAEAAKLVSGAAERFMERTGGKAYTYTHAWRDVPREAWGSVSVLASCETMSDVEQAWARGYAAAVVVNEHSDWHTYLSGQFRVMPCPKQTGKSANCKACRVCMRDSLLRKAKLVVAFAAHGATKKVKAVLASKAVGECHANQQ
jgi:hypothetical protein